MSLTLSTVNPNGYLNSLKCRKKLILLIIPVTRGMQKIFCADNESVEVRLDSIFTSGIIKMHYSQNFGGINYLVNVTLKHSISQ